MCEESCRCGAVQIVGRNHSACKAEGFEAFGDIGDGLFIRIHSEEIVGGLLAGGISSSGCGRVCREIAVRLGADIAIGVEIGNSQLATVGIHAGVDSRQAHAVADQQDDVAHLAVRAVKTEIRSVGALVVDSSLSDICGEFCLLDVLSERWNDKGQQDENSKYFLHFSGELSIKQI